GPNTSANTVAPSCSITWLRPRRSASGASAASSPGPSPIVEPSSRTSSFAPSPSPATIVSTTARPPVSTTPRSSSKTLMPAPAPAKPAPPLSGRLRQAYAGSLERLDEDVDLAAARQADLERHVVRDAVRQEAGRSAAQHLLRREDDVALHATARDRAGELAAVAHRELRADGSRRRPAGGDNGRERHLLAA